MNTLNSMNEIGWDRRRFLSVAAASVAATQLGMVGPAKAQMKVAAIRAGTNTSFAPLKQIDAGVLNVGYAEAGPANGEPANAASDRTLKIAAAVRYVALVQA